MIRFICEYTRVWTVKNEQISSVKAILSFRLEPALEELVYFMRIQNASMQM